MSWRARLSRCIYEVRFHTNQLPTSFGLRNWLSKNHSYITELNSEVGFFHESNFNIRSKIIVTFAWGYEKEWQVEEATTEEIDKVFEEIVNVGSQYVTSPDFKPSRHEILNYFSEPPQIETYNDKTHKTLYFEKYLGLFKGDIEGESEKLNAAVSSITKKND
eukprot:TRINITY_DN852_c0_g4_i1.p1 TRINITY_DN852_c0_g4~~TRINITY_DN852_c0_g4_i1.p1  ORF type:complete len:162 (-),score=57.62 TRINITY_DN852_c0_g4_i1:81-566(-)